METSLAGIVRDCTEASDEERVAFPQIVRRLIDAGVERYHADLVRATKTYYLADGDDEEVPCQGLTLPPASAFSAADVEAAVRASQRGEIGYREFCRRVAAAGCVGYLVSLTGKRVVYYGRTGETHVEAFPSAEP